MPKLSKILPATVPGDVWRQFFASEKMFLAMLEFLKTNARPDVEKLCWPRCKTFYDLLLIMFC